jgi:hypothetical protein
MKTSETYRSEIVVRISVWDIMLFIVLFHLTFWPIFFRLVNFQ